MEGSEDEYNDSPPLYDEICTEQPVPANLHPPIGRVHQTNRLFFLSILRIFTLQFKELGEPLSTLMMLKPLIQRVLILTVHCTSSSPIGIECGYFFWLQD